MLHSKNVPYYAFPGTLNPKDIFSKYNLSPVTVERELRIGAEVETKVVRIAPRVQKSIYNHIITMKPIAPFIVGVSSAPTDVFALQTCGYMHYALLLNNPSIKVYWHNSMRKVNTHEEKDYDVVFIYNVTVGADSWRLQSIRDALSFYNRALRIVVVAGINAVEFFDNYLHHGLSGMINIYSTNKGFVNTYNTLDLEEKQDFSLATEVFSPELIKMLLDANKGNVKRRK